MVRSTAKEVARKEPQDLGPETQHTQPNTGPLGIFRDQELMKGAGLARQILCLWVGHVRAGRLRWTRLQSLSSVLKDF